LGNARGAVLMILAMAGFAVEDMFIKLMAGALPVGQILILIGAGGAVIFGGWAMAHGQAPITTSMLRGASGWRALFEGIASIGFVTALTLVPLSVVTMITQVNPLLVTLVAAVVFGETVGWRRWSAICVGLVGVLIVLRPFGEGFEAATLFAVMGVLAQTGRDLATRRVTASISTAQISTLGFLSGIPAGMVALLVSGQYPVMPDARTFAYIFGAIAIGIPALYCIIASMRVGDMSFVAPFRYSRIVFGLLIGMLAFGERLDFFTLLGAAIITGSGLYTFAREARLRRNPSPAPAPAL